MRIKLNNVETSSLKKKYSADSTAKLLKTDEKRFIFAICSLLSDQWVNLFTSRMKTIRPLRSMCLFPCHSVWSSQKRWTVVKEQSEILQLVAVASYWRRSNGRQRRQDLYSRYAGWKLNNKNPAKLPFLSAPEHHPRHLPPEFPFRVNVVKFNTFSG